MPASLLGSIGKYGAATGECRCAREQVHRIGRCRLSAGLAPRARCRSFCPL